MGTRTEPVRLSAAPMSGEGATLEWLDALASGACTPEAFLGAMRHHFQGNRDGSWEVLSLLDQHYRRGKIKAEVFRSLKMRLEGAALNGEEGATLPQASERQEATSSVAAPTPASQNKPPPKSPAAVQEVTIGDLLRSRYLVRGVLGRGGMGTVFEAVDEYRLDLPSTGQRIAVKVLHRAVTRREELLAELQREFQHLQLLSHPNIVRVHEFDRDGEFAFFTMELLNGALLSKVLNARNSIALPRHYALAIMRDVGAALAHAHSRGVLHGDVNPQNIFITNDGELRVLDFGASHKLRRPSPAVDNELSQRAPVATAGYASCQLLEGQQPDARDDLFAFACVAYVLLSGRHPFPDCSAVEARAQALRPRRPPRLTGRQWRLLRQGLGWERDRRPSDVRQWLDKFDLTGAAVRLPSLSVLADARRPWKRQAVLAVAGIMTFVLLALGGYWAATERDSIAHHVMEWTARARAAVDAPHASPKASVPAVAPPSASLTPRPTPTQRAASQPPQTDAPSTASTPRPTDTAAASRPSTADTSPLPSASLPASTRAAVVTQPSIQEASAHAGTGWPTRVEMVADTVDVLSSETTARVTVRRKGSLHGDTNFSWWTESGTAKPGRDFAAVAPRVEHIGNGSVSVSLSIPVLNTPRARAKSFYVVIDRTETGAAVGARTLTMVTLQPPD